MDSNFFFIPLRFGVDIFEELKRLFGENVRYIVLSVIVDEIKLLKEDANNSLKKEVDFALLLTEKCRVIDEVVKPGENIDDVILRTSMERGYIVATNDSELRRRLREKAVSVVYLRQLAFLEVDGLPF